MVRFPRLALRITTAAVATMVLALVGGAPVSAAPATPPEDTSPTWTLLDLGQRICAHPNDPRTLYYFVAFEGTWSVPIMAHYTGMPDGTEIYGPLIAEPGSGDGEHVQIWAAFRLHDAALGRHVPLIWATDGVSTQSVPVTLDINTLC